jgi:hypothetical protein
MTGRIGMLGYVILIGFLVLMVLVTFELGILFFVWL